MANSYPVPAQPRAEGVLPNRDGHICYFKEYGRADGIPILYMPGGPGAGASPSSARFFDPDAFLIILFDPRGAGKSTPAGAIHDNMQAHVIDDFETLRVQLGIESWYTFGGSAGAGFSLHYGETYPERVAGQILWNPFMFQPAEVEWIMQGGRGLFPEAQQTFEDFLPVAERKDLLTAYYNRIVDRDLSVSLPAAKAWMAHERACALIGGALPPLAMTDAEQWQEARIESHYFRHNLTNPFNRVLRHIDRLKDVPTMIIQGDRDGVCPLPGAQALKRQLPRAHLQIVAAGHAASQPAIEKALIESTDRIRDTGSPLPPATPERRGGLDLV